MKRVSRQLLLAVAVVIVFVLVWQKVRIWIMISLSVWQALFFFGLGVLFIYLILDHLFNRE